MSLLLQLYHSTSWWSNWRDNSTRFTVREANSKQLDSFHSLLEKSLLEENISKQQLAEQRPLEQTPPSAPINPPTQTSSDDKHRVVGRRTKSWARKKQS